MDQYNWSAMTDKAKRAAAILVQPIAGELKQHGAGDLYVEPTPNGGAIIKLVLGNRITRTTIAPDGSVSTSIDGWD